jgi:hypothetical protein
VGKEVFEKKKSIAEYISYSLLSSLNVKHVNGTWQTIRFVVEKYSEAHIPSISRVSKRIPTTEESRACGFNNPMCKRTKPL